MTDVIVRRLDRNHDMTFGQGRANYAAFDEAIAQSVRTRLMTLREEWFLDENAGVPYTQQIMVKPANLQLAAALIKAEILGTFGVISLTEFELDFDTATRVISIYCIVRNKYGTVATIRVQQ